MLSATISPPAHRHPARGRTPQSAPRSSPGQANSRSRSHSAGLACLSSIGLRYPPIKRAVDGQTSARVAAIATHDIEVRSSSHSVLAPRQLFRCNFLEHFTDRASRHLARNLEVLLGKLFHLAVVVASLGNQLFTAEVFQTPIGKDAFSVKRCALVIDIPEMHLDVARVIRWIRAGLAFAVRLTLITGLFDVNVVDRAPDDIVEATGGDDFEQCFGRQHHADRVDAVDFGDGSPLQCRVDPPPVIRPILSAL
mgnify:FL=1